MQRFMILAALAFTALASAQSQARSFYKAEMKLSVQYTSLATGTQDLLSEHKLAVHYSDDHDFCEVRVGDAAFKCHSYHADDQPEETMITMDRGIGGQIVAAALANCKTDSNIQASFVRLATYLDDTIDVEWQGDDFYQQIHDTVPESFHVWFFEMSKGTKY